MIFLTLLSLIGFYTVTVILSTLAFNVLIIYHDEDEKEWFANFIPIFNIGIMLYAILILLILPFKYLYNLGQRLNKIEKRLKIKWKPNQYANFVVKIIIGDLKLNLKNYVISVIRN